MNEGNGGIKRKQRANAGVERRRRRKRGRMREEGKNAIVQGQRIKWEWGRGECTLRRKHLQNNQEKKEKV